MPVKGLGTALPERRGRGHRPAAPPRRVAGSQVPGRVLTNSNWPVPEQACTRASAAAPATESAGAVTTPHVQQLAAQPARSDQSGNQHGSHTHAQHVAAAPEHDTARSPPTAEPAFPDVQQQQQQQQQASDAPPPTQQAAARASSQGTRQRRSRLSPAATDPTAAALCRKRGGAATSTLAAADKRHKPGARAWPPSGGGLYADVLHRVVEVPGAVFFVDEPGAVYVGRVNKLESGRNVPSVEVQFFDDGSKYWFPVADVRCWMADMAAAGRWAMHNCGVPYLRPDAAAPSADEEKAAAEALQSMSASLCSSSAQATGDGGTHQVLSSARQPSVAGADADAASSGVQLQRCGIELKRVGALDIMVLAAADACAGGGPPKSEP